jgi:iron complex transport system substrate-binding protein
MAGLVGRFIFYELAMDRLIGLTWLLHKLYPDQAPGNLCDQVRAFYRQFYQVEPTDAEIGRVLDGS